MLSQVAIGLVVFNLVVSLYAWRRLKGSARRRVGMLAIVWLLPVFGALLGVLITFMDRTPGQPSRSSGSTTQDPADGAYPYSYTSSDAAGTGWSGGCDSGDSGGGSDGGGGCDGGGGGGGD